MADIVQANYESLAAVAKRFAQQSNKIRQMHDRLNRQMTLLRPTWVGKGSEAFFAEMGDKVLPAVQRLSAALAEADRLTKQIEILLRSAEEQGSSPFRRDTDGILPILPYGPVAEFGSGGSDEGSGSEGETGGAGDEAGGSAGGERSPEEVFAYPGGSRDFDEGGGGSYDEAGGAAGDYDGDAGDAGDEAGGGAGEIGSDTGGYDEGSGGVGDDTGGAGGYDEGIGGSGGGLGEDFVGDLEDFGREFSIDNLDGGSGGAWDDNNFRPSDIDNAPLDQLYRDYGFDVAGNFDGGEMGTLGSSGGDSSFTVPDDWLSGVDEAFNSPWNEDLGQDLAGASGGSDAGSASGGGGESSGSNLGGGAGSGAASGGGSESSGSDMGGSTGSGGASGGGAPMGRAIPAGETGQTSTGGMPLGQGSGLGTSGQAAAAALPGPLRYTALGGGGAGMKTTVMDAEMPTAAAAPVAAAPQAAQANVGVPMGIAALAPLFALVGKAVKDRSSGR